MSRYEATVSLELPHHDGDEFQVRADVSLEMTGRGWQAFFDGGVEVFAFGEWQSMGDLGLSKADRDRVEQALADEALEDDSDECDREERDERRAEGWR
jgi:hypothetical protein